MKRFLSESTDRVYVYTRNASGKLKSTILPKQNFRSLNGASLCYVMFLNDCIITNTSFGCHRKKLDSSSSLAKSNQRICNNWPILSANSFKNRNGHYSKDACRSHYINLNINNTQTQIQLNMLSDMQLVNHRHVLHCNGQSNQSWRQFVQDVHTA